MWKNTIFLFVLIAILALATYLRLSHLTDNPYWYTDETTHIDIARHLMNGEIRYLAVEDSTLLFARLPLFGNMLSLLFRVFGVEISVLRGFTAILGILTIIVLYVALRRQDDPMLATIAALMLAVYPEAVIYNRIGYSYSLLTLLMMIMTWGLWEYMRHGGRRWLFLAALALGLGTISEVMAWSFIPAFALIVLIRDWHDTLWSLPLVALPFALYALVMLITAPDAFLFDLRFTLGRLGGAPLAAQIETLINNLQSQNLWFFAGMFGLFALRPPSLCLSALLLFFVPLLLIGRTNALYNLSFYYLIPLLPFVALGVAALLRFGLSWFTQPSATLQRIATIAAQGLAAALILCVVGLPLMQPVMATLQAIPTHLQLDIEPFLVNPTDARAVASYVNGMVSESDVVIASPVVGWAINANVADFQMAIAAEGRETPHLPADLPQNRWAFDPRFDVARFIIIDHLWRNWGVVHVPGLVEWVNHVESTWQLGFEAGTIRVYSSSLSS